MDPGVPYATDQKAPGCASVFVRKREAGAFIRFQHCHKKSLVGESSGIGLDDLFRQFFFGNAPVHRLFFNISMCLRLIHL